MTQYVLFTVDELEAMLCGEEVECEMQDGSVLHFMEQESYNKMLKGEENNA